MKAELLNLLSNEVLVYTLMAIVPLVWVIPFALVRRLVGAQDLRAHAGPARPDAHGRVAWLGADDRGHRSS